MTAQTPLLLVENITDTVVAYPTATLDASDAAAGREAFRIADYRRERSWWQPTTDGGGSDQWLRVQLAAAQTVDYVWLDRGHNLAGLAVFLEGSTDGATWTVSQQLNVPASASIGGTPAAPAMAATEEGCAWTIVTGLASKAWWRLRIPHATGFIPVVTGLMIGRRTQLLGYSNVFDEDASTRTVTTETSIAGYQATDTTYAWRTCELQLALIGSTEYDATVRALRTAIFANNQPWVLFMNYGDRPERGWLFQYDGTSWSMPLARVYRGGTIKGRECGQSLG